MRSFTHRRARQTHLTSHLDSYNDVKAASLSNLQFRSSAEVNIGGLFFSCEAPRFDAMIDN